MSRPERYESHLEARHLKPGMVVGDIGRTDRREVVAVEVESGIVTLTFQNGWQTLTPTDVLTVERTGCACPTAGPT